MNLMQGLQDERVEKKKKNHTHTHRKRKKIVLQILVLCFAFCYWNRTFVKESISLTILYHVQDPTKKRKLKNLTIYLAILRSRSVKIGSNK